MHQQNSVEDEKRIEEKLGTPQLSVLFQIYAFIPLCHGKGLLELDLWLNYIPREIFAQLR